MQIHLCNKLFGVQFTVVNVGDAHNFDYTALMSISIGSACVIGSHHNWEAMGSSGMNLGNRDVPFWPLSPSTFLVQLFIDVGQLLTEMSDLQSDMHSLLLNLV